MANTTASACSSISPRSALTAVMCLSLDTSSTMVSRKSSMSVPSNWETKRWAYSGPVSSWPK